MVDYGYSRVSSADQQQSGLSISAQHERLSSVGILDANVFTDGARSGGVKDEDKTLIFRNRHFITDIDLTPRPAFCELLEKLQPSDSITFTRWDRMSRHKSFLDNLRDFCRRNDIKLTCLDESDNPLVVDMLAAFGEEELRKTKQRNRTVHESIYSRGGWPFKSPYGYIRNKKVKGILQHPDFPDACLLIHPEESKVVVAVFEGVASGKTPDVVARELNINVSTAYDIIKSKVYCGQTHLNKNLDWKPSPLIPRLVSDAVWKRANDSIKGRTFRAGERKADFEPKVAS